MAEEKIKQILINGRMVGITGWEEAQQKVADARSTKNEKDLKEALLSAIAGKNYIPAALRIAVLGAGCARCGQMEDDVRELLAEMKIAADLQHITDAKQIAAYGVMGAPSLVINNKVVSVGEVPPKSKIRQWLIEAYPAPQKES